jgi:enoyl-CoA hydratase/carnithine racemase
MTGHVQVTKRDGIGWISLDRGERRHALTMSMWQALGDAALRLADSDLSAVILTGNGGAFCAGNDLQELQVQLRDSGSVQALHHLMDQSLMAIRDIKVPTIAAIDGPCFGAGLSLATACDLRVASSRASFCAPPAKLGLVYGEMELRTLIQLIGPARTKELIFTARVLDAQEAHAIGLIERLVDDDAGRAAGTLAAEMASLSRTTQRSSKQMIDHLALGLPDQPWLEELRQDAALHADLSQVSLGAGRRR